MDYFLTGATGFVGSHLAKYLRAHGHEVRAVVRTPDKAQDLKNIGVQLFKGDVTDKESMRAAMQGCDGVFHVAGWYKLGVHDKSQGAAVNIQGTQNVLELMLELKIPKGVYTSTLAVNSDVKGTEADESFKFTGTHLSEYDRTKAEAHKIAHEMIAKGLPLVVVMPGLIYGPGDTSSVRKSLVDFLKGKLPMIPAETAYSWAYIDDIVEAHYLAMTKGKLGEDYIICGPTHSLDYAMSLASKITGKKKPRVAPAGWIRFMSYLVRPFDRWMPEEYTSEYLRVLGGVTYIGNNLKAQKELGYHPRPLDQGLKLTLDHEMKLL